MLTLNFSKLPQEVQKPFFRGQIHDVILVITSSSILFIYKPSNKCF